MPANDTQSLEFHEKWEDYYREAVQRDFERAIYKRCDEEDAEELSHG